MKLCPVCNSFQSIDKSCPLCVNMLIDGGRVADYLDPYGHYNDIETSNLSDGFQRSTENEQCPHLLYCEHCNYDEVLIVKEQSL